MSTSLLYFRRLLLSQSGRSAAKSSFRTVQTCRTKRNYNTSRTTCPFATLGLSKSSDPLYVDVKSRFQELALKHHPDRLALASDDGNNESKESAKNKRLTREEATSRFVRYRMAFEAIVESDDGSGLAILKEDAEYFKAVKQANAASSPKGEHQHATPNYEDISRLRVDPQVLHEMAELGEDMAPGGLDKGGMWQFAAAMRERAKRGDLPPLQVSEGENNNQGKSARRRRRKR